MFQACQKGIQGVCSDLASKPNKDVLAHFGFAAGSHVAFQELIDHA